MHQQPTELDDFYGKGLYLWQYPNQLASFLTTEYKNLSSVGRYVEIGSRWCGTFILMSEFIFRINPNLKEIIAVDIIQEPKTLSMYRKYISKNGGPSLIYSAEGTQYFKKVNYSKTEKTLCFIDGDHSLQAVMRDHQVALDFADLIVHHDISSDATPQIKVFWEFIKTLQTSEWNFSSYIDQYESVRGNFLGIGFMMKKLEIKD